MVVGEQAAFDFQRLLHHRLSLGVVPLGIKVERHVVVAFGGVGVVVGEQAAADLQRLFVKRLGLGVLPLGIEAHRHVVVAFGGVGVVVGEQAAEDLLRLLVKRLGLGVLPLGVERFRLLRHGARRLVGESILIRHRRHPPQCLETPLRAHRLEVLRPLDPRPQGEQFLGPGDRLAPAIGRSAASMALSNSSARLASSPVSLINPCGRDCASFGDVVWAIAGEPGFTIPSPISIPSRNTT